MNRPKVIGSPNIYATATEVTVSLMVEPHLCCVLEDAFTLNIDLAQTGVGGTDTWSKRSRPYDPYRLMEKEYSYGFWIIPLK